MGTGLKPIGQIVYEAYMIGVYGKYPDQQAPDWAIHVREDDKIAWQAAAQALVSYLFGRAIP